MNSKTLVFSVTTILSASALFAEPRVDQSAVTLAQDSRSRLVTVGYELTGEPAVVHWRRQLHKRHWRCEFGRAARSAHNHLAARQELA